MTQTSSSLPPGPGLLPPEDWPQIDHLITEDSTTMKNIFTEKQQRLLVEPLYSSWAGPGEGRPFVALTNVGLFYSIYEPPFVPDMLLAADVQIPADLWTKANRAYFTWQYGYPPDVVVEIVSGPQGAEIEKRMRGYLRIAVDYYVIFDPAGYLGEGPLRVYGDHGGVYCLLEEGRLRGVGLRATLWKGIYEGQEQTWMRWCDLEGLLIPTGAERAEQEHQRAEQERQRAERLAARMRALGIEPDES